MADEKVFSVKIDGLEKSYKDTVKLLDVLTSIKDVHAKVTVETEAMSKATIDSANKTKEKTKVLTEEEKALKKLKDTQDKARKPITELEKAQEKANRQLKERSKLLQQQVTEETAAQNSIAQMKAELKKLNEEWNNVDMNSDRFKELTDEIDKLTNKLKEAEAAKGTFTRNVGNYPQQINSINESFKKLGDGINNTANNTKGMLNLFQAGVGIALMFDDKNSDLAKTLNSLGKIMAIIGALQQANNLLLTKGAIASKGAAVMESVHALQIKARATAISLATKNTLAASVAQKVFNLVAAANPYVLLAMALISVVGALVLFASSTESARERQERMNKAVENSIELKGQYASKLKAVSDANVSEMQRELELMKSRGASQAELAKQERKIQEEKLKNAQKMAKYYEQEIENIGENSKRVDEYTKQLLDLDTQLYEGKIKDLDAYNSKRDLIVQKLEISNRRLTQGLTAREDLRKAENDLAKFTASTSKTASDAAKKDAVAMAEYRVLIAKKGSREELKANIEAINVRLKAELSSADITKGERVKRTEEALQQIKKLEEDFRKSQLQDDITWIDARLIVVKKGSLEEYNLQVARLEQQKKIELENKEITKNQKLLVENKYQEDLDKLTANYCKRKAETEINTSISTINERLANVARGTKKEYDLKIELAKKSARLAEEEAKATIKNEELKAAKIKEIYAQMLKEINELSAEGEVSSVSGKEKKETLSLIQDLEKRKISKREYEDKMLALSIDSLQKEIDIRKKYGQDTTDLEISLSEMRIDQGERERNKITRHFEEMNAKLQEIAGNVMKGITAIFDVTNSVMQAQLDDANEKYDAISKKYDEVVAKREESMARIEDLEKQAHDARGGRFLALQDQILQEMQTNAELAGQEKQLAKDKEKQEKEIAKKERQMKKAQILSDIVQGGVNTALAITSAMTVKPFPLGVVLAGVAGTMGAVQVGVMTKQLSKLEDGGLLKGKRHTEGGMRVEGTNIEVEGGEYVINRISTNKNLGLIKYINSQRRELKPSDLSSFFSNTQSFDPPFKRIFETGGMLPPVENTINIDNESLIEAIQSIKIEPKVAVTDINNAQENLVTVDNWTGL